jgi:hypothetical protein
MILSVRPIPRGTERAAENPLRLRGPGQGALIGAGVGILPACVYTQSIQPASGERHAVLMDRICALRRHRARPRNCCITPTVGGGEQGQVAVNPFDRNWLSRRGGRRRGIRLRSSPFIGLGPHPPTPSPKGPKGGRGRLHQSPRHTSLRLQKTRRIHLRRRGLTSIKMW